MFLKSAFVSLALFASALAAPATDLVKKDTTVCGDFDTVSVGPYTFNNNLWGKGAATSGQQCSTVGAANGNTVAWSTSWSWEGGQYNVKSYPELQLFPGRVLNTISSVPTTWQWSYTGDNLVADVAYDIWLGDSAQSQHNFEIMIWLTALGGAFPISSSGQPIATVPIGPATWNLYNGPNQNFQVYSFVATAPINDFNADLKQFFDYLVNNQGIPSTQVLQEIDSGTEPFTGENAVLTTTAYSVAVN